MTRIKDIIAYLEQMAPSAYQESYDNAGLLTGDPEAEVKGILVTLDATEPVVDEAVARGCNMIVAHHPIIFKGMKSLTGKNYVERTIIKAIKQDVAIFAAHTNLDNVHTGVNRKISDKIGLFHPQILSPKNNVLAKLTTFVPHENADAVLNAMSDAGAGNIGNYKNCSFQLAGEGTFEPTEAANPHIGEANKLERVEEKRLEVVFPRHLTQKILHAMREAHPYEEVAYFLHDIVNEENTVGSGMVGELPELMDEMEFLQFLKDRMELSCIRYTPLRAKKVKRVAVCGGAGQFLLPQAIRQQADVFVTSDFKYHEFFDADGRLVIADIGHYESEVFTKELLSEFLSQKFVNFAVLLAKTVTNPVQYL